MVAKWMDVEIYDWLAEWMNESVIHSECGYIFLLWQKTNFWSYSWNVGGCNSKLSLINPIQPSRDHLLLVQCRIPRLSVHLSPQPSSIHLPMHRWSTPGSRHCLDRSPSAFVQWQPLFSSLHFLDISCSTVFCCSHSPACPALQYCTIGFLFYLFFLPCPRSSLRLLFYPLFFLCSSYAQSQSWSQPLGLGLEQEQVFKAL